MKTRHTHHYHLHYLHIGRVIFIGLALLAVGFARADVRPPVTAKHVSQVLAYATNINQTDLLNGTNAARAQNGLGGFALSSKLNTSAQLKANDMIAKNYWAHTAPDGTQPWYWFSQAGYDYTAAGENLAYGFDTSDAAVTAWMNSAGHRANILGSYRDVGFGIANGENYQGGEYTVVVAHYGTERASSPPAVPAPTTPAQTPSTPAPVTPAVPEAPAPVPTETAPTPTPASPTSAPETPPPTANKPIELTVATSPAPSTVPLWQQVINGHATLITAASLTLLGGAGVGFALTHLKLMRRTFITGEKYLLHHPVMDAGVLATATLFVFMTTVGHIG